MVSQASQKNQLSKEDLEIMAKDVVMYILSQDHRKRPIKRPDLAKHTGRAPGKKFDHVIKVVQEMFMDTFGLELVNLGGTPSRYCLINKFSSEQLSQLLTVPSIDCSKRSLLMIILAYIFMSGVNIKENSLWRSLKVMGINADDKKPHPIYGDVKKLVLQDFVRQLYLEHVKIPESDPPTMELRWGPRARKEFSKTVVLEFVCKMYGGMDPKNWTVQYQQAQKEDIEKMDESSSE